MAKKKSRSKRRKFRRNKMLPYKEGAIQQVADLFLKPLVAHRPDFYSRKDFLDELFGCFDGYLPRRSVVHCRALHSFQIKGRIWMPDGSKRVVTEFRRVPQGTSVFIRTDDLLPEYKDKLDVEIVYGSAKKGEVYEITYFQWNRIKGSLVRASDYEQYR